MIITTRIRVLGAALAAVGALALVSTAFAGSPPRPADPAIVVNESLGGVSIGQSSADAEAAWAVAPRCKKLDESRVCRYGSIKSGSATIIEQDGAVVIATINAPLTKRSMGVPNFKGPLMKFATTEGDLGLGDKLSQVAARFPGGTRKAPNAHSLDYIENGVRMSFFASRPNVGLITAITIAKEDLG